MAEHVSVAAPDYIGRWTEDHVERFRDLELTHRNVLKAVAIVSFLYLLFVVVAPHLYFVWLVSAIAGAVISVYYLKGPTRDLATYERLREAWAVMLDRSDPHTVIATSIRLDPSEGVVYANPSARYAERHLGEEIKTVTRSKGTVGRAVVGGLIAGPAGAIIGGATSAKVETGTTNSVYGLALVDQGQLILTDRRVLFIGNNHTIEIPVEKIMRYSVAESPTRLVVEYAGREAGESYTIDPVLFRLCAVRRSSQPMLQAFGMPDPFHPLPLNTTKELLQQTLTGLTA